MVLASLKQPTFESDIYVYSHDSYIPDPTNLVNFVAYLTSAYDVQWKAQQITRVKGYETLEFKCIREEFKKYNIKTEMYIQCSDRWYVIKTIKNSKEDNNLVEISCYAAWYEIGNNGNNRKQFTFNNADHPNITIGAFIKLLCDWYFDSGSNRSITHSNSAQAYNSEILTGIPNTTNSVLWWFRWLTKAANLDIFFHHDSRYPLPVNRFYLQAFRNSTVNEAPSDAKISKTPLISGLNITGTERIEDSRELVTEMRLTGMKDETTGKAYKMTLIENLVRNATFKSAASASVLPNWVSSTGDFANVAPSNMYVLNNGIGDNDKPLSPILATGVAPDRVRARATSAPFPVKSNTKHTLQFDIRIADVTDTGKECIYFYVSAEGRTASLFSFRRTIGQLIATTTDKRDNIWRTFRFEMDVPDLGSGNFVGRVAIGSLTGRNTPKVSRTDYREIMVVGYPLNQVPYRFVVNSLDAKSDGELIDYAFNYNYFYNNNQLPKCIMVTKSDDRFNDGDSMRQSAQTYVDLYGFPTVSYVFNLSQARTLPSLYDWQLIIDLDNKVTEFRKISEISYTLNDTSSVAITFADPRSDAIDIINDTGDDIY